MANADFSQKKNNSTGGFDAGSYREAAKPAPEAKLTPLQQKLAALENALPAALRQRTGALALAAVIMLGSFMGFGSVKLRSKYAEAKTWYSAGVEADSGYTLEEELIARENAAASTITAARHIEGVAGSQELETAQAALDSFAELRAAAKDGAGVQAVYAANETLGREIDALYAKMRENAADPMNPGGEYGRFTSAQTIINNLSYNSKAAAYQDELDSSLGVIRLISGVKKVELFA